MRLTKRCARCTYTLPLSQFSGNPRARDGLQSYCRGCACAAARECEERHQLRRAKNPELVPAEKPCATCKEILPLSEFYVDRRTRYGVRSTCKFCCAMRWPATKAWVS